LRKKNEQGIIFQALEDRLSLPKRWDLKEEVQCAWLASASGQLSQNWEMVRKRAAFGIIIAY